MMLQAIFVAAIAVYFWFLALARVEIWNNAYPRIAIAAGIIAVISGWLL